MKKTHSDLTIFAILTTITLLTWVIVEGYQRFYKTEIETVPEAILSPINPNIETQYLDQLEQEKQLSPEEFGKYKSPKTGSTSTDTSAATSEPKQIGATSSGEGQ